MISEENVSHLKSINFIKSHRKLLTEEEEKELFREWKETKDQNLLMKIIIHYSPIIRKAAKELSSYQIDQEELISEGILALIRAAERFDTERNIRFATYARHWCKGIMYGYITKNYFLVNICTNHNKKTLFFELRKIIAIELKEHSTFNVTYELAKELSKKFDVSERDVYNIANIIRNGYDSLDEPIKNNDDSEITRGDLIPSESSLEDMVIKDKSFQFYKTVLDDVMDKILTTREKKIFVSQELSYSEDVKTLESLGQEFNISKERVRQIRNGAKQKVETELLKMAKENKLNVSDMFS
jgi:RNA polymerase sigma-32 factor